MALQFHNILAGERAGPRIEDGDSGIYRLALDISEVGVDGPPRLQFPTAYRLPNCASVRTGYSHHANAANTRGRGNRGNGVRIETSRFRLWQYDSNPPDA